MNSCYPLGRCWFSTLAHKLVCSTLWQLATYGSKLYSAGDSVCYHAIYMTHRRYSNTPQGRQTLMCSLRNSVDVKSNFKWPQTVNISFLGENWISGTVKRPSKFVATQDRFGNTGNTVRLLDFEDISQSEYQNKIPSSISMKWCWGNILPRPETKWEEYG